MAVVAKIIQALAAIIPFIVEWWAKRKAAKSQAESEARVADIRANPGSEWLRKFNSQANPDGNSSGAPGADEPRGDK